MKTKTVKRWKFLGTGMRSQAGDCVWTIGEWKKQPGVIKLCENGFHCSKDIYQAFRYALGDILAQVECRGRSDISDDQEAYSEMRVIQAYKWQNKDSVALALFAAEQVLTIHEKQSPNEREAIAAARLYLKDPSTKNQVAARTAGYGWVVTWAAVEGWVAAIRAVESATQATGDVMRKRVASWMKHHVKDLSPLDNSSEQE